MSSFLQDVRYAIRGFSRNPAFTAVALVTIALGVGVNTAIFCVVDAVLLRPLGVSDERRVVQIIERVPSAGTGAYTVSLLNFEDYRDQTASFDQAATLQAPNPTELFVASDPRPVKLNAYLASSTFLPMLRVNPVLGHTFAADADRPGGPLAMLISETMWERLFRRDPDVVGRTLTSLSPAGDFTIVGVLPAGFEVPPVTHNATGGFGGKGLALRTECDALVSMSLLPPNFVTSPNARVFRPFAALARLKPDVGLEQAQADVDLVAARIAAQDPSFAGYTAEVTPLVTVLHRAYGGGLFFLWATAGIALLIVCVNVAGFLLVRAAGRERELGVRMALGSGRWRLMRQALTESLLLGVTGGAVGIALALWGVQLLKTLLPRYVYRLDEVQLDPGVLALAIAMTVGIAVLFGLLPAMQSVRPRMLDTLKGGARTSSGRRLRLLGTLVVAEIALAVVLLTGAGLTVASFGRLMAVAPGFDREHLLAVETETLPPGLSKYTGERSAELARALVAAVAAVPDVVSVAGVSRPPLGLYRGVASFTLADRPPPGAGELRPSLNFESVTPAYFETMGIPLLRGRAFTDDDARSTQSIGPDARQRYQAASAEERSRMRQEVRLPIVINDVMARRYWPDQDPVGRQMYLGQVDLEQPPLQIMTIVGVVPEAKTKSMSEAPRIQAYVPTPAYVPWLMVRTRAASAATEVGIRTAIEAIDPSEIAVVVARRTHEIGIRMSLGAAPRAVVLHVLGWGMRLAVMGTVIGVAASLVFARSISALLFEVSPIAPGLSAVVVLGLGVVALAACYLPARQASRVSPVEALRLDLD